MFAKVLMFVLDCIACAIGGAGAMLMVTSVNEERRNV